MVKNALAVKIGKLKLSTPLMTASGTSGSGNEMDGLAKVHGISAALGAFVTKGVSLKPRKGNPGVRIVETDSGIINSIGLQNKGAASFLKNELPLLERYKLPVIVNISASSVDEFAVLADFICKNDQNRQIAALEINVSCPNIKEGGIAFGVDPVLVEKVVKAVHKKTGSLYTIITKLSPNVSDISLPAKGAIAGGTDALSMINTLRGMAIDIRSRKPLLGNKIGGLSGPAIKPVGLFMVYDCFSKVPECKKKKVPIIGIGGVSSWQDSLEYMLAGASAVGIGTAWFVNPEVFIEIKKGLEAWCKKNSTTLKQIIGQAHKA